MKEVPLGSKLDPPLATAEPINEADGTSVKTSLSKGKKSFEAAERDTSQQKGEKHPTDTKVSEEGGGLGASGTGSEGSPCRIMFLGRNCSPWGTCAGAVCS